MALESVVAVALLGVRASLGAMQSEPPPIVDATVEPDGGAAARAKALLGSARAARDGGDHAGALAQVTRAIEILLSAPAGARSGSDVEILAELGVAAFHWGDLPLSRRAFEEALHERTRTLPDDHEDLQSARANLASALYGLGELQAPRELQEKVLEVRTRTLPDDHRKLQEARSNLALTLADLGEFEAARSLQEKVLDVWTGELPENHRDLQTARGNLALTLIRLGEPVRARELQERVLAVLLETVPDDDPGLQAARANLGETLTHLGDYQRALLLHEKTLEVYSRTRPEEHPDIARATNNLGLTHFHRGDRQQALALFRKVLELRARTLPDDHQDLQQARGNLASTLVELGDLRGARQLEEKVLDVYSRTLPAEHPLTLQARGNLALTLLKLGEAREALRLQEPVVEILSRTLSPEHPDLQLARLSLAGILGALGDLRGARRLGEDVVAMLGRSLPEEHPQLQVARLNLAETLRDLGETPRAAELVEDVIVTLSRTLPEGHPWLQQARANLAATRYSLGDLQAARSLQEAVLETYSRTETDESPAVLDARTNLATTLRELGDLRGARLMQEEIVAARSRTLPPDHPTLQLARAGLAATLSLLGEAEAARILLESVVESLSRSLPDDHPNLQSARGHLAGALARLGEVDAARRLQEQVVAMLSRTLPAEHHDVLWAKGNLASTLRSLGDFQAARTLHEEISKSLVRSLRADHPDLQLLRLELAGMALSELADRRIRSARIGEPIPFGEESAARARIGELLSELARGCSRAMLYALVDASSREAEERVASTALVVSDTLSLSTGSGILSPDPEWTRLSFVASESSRAAAIASARLRRAARGDGAHEAIHGRIREAGADLAAIVQKGATSDELADARTRLEAAERELSRLAATRFGMPVDLLQTDWGSIARGFRPGDALVAYRRYRRVSVDESRPTRLAGEDSLCAFVLRSNERPGAPPGEPLVRVELGPFEPIAAAVERWRAVVASGRERGATAIVEVDADSAKHGETLRRLVVDPLRGELAGATRIVVIPDDDLNCVPLDALPSGAVWSELGGKPAAGGPDVPLGTVLRVELRSSLLEILSEPPAAFPGRPVLVALGHPAFDIDPVLVPEEPERTEERTDDGATSVAASPRDAKRSGPLRGGRWERGFPTLPETRAEVLAIGDYYEDAFGDRDGAIVLLRKEAASENLIALAPKARFLHVATHGWFAPESVKSWADPEPSDARSSPGTRLGTEDTVRGMSPMLLCGLALAGANLPAGTTGRIPGLVTAEELATLDLANCELAVLSACDTNVGVRRAGQGVASLQRALHMAGARSVITSLWKVPDEATKELMVDFYRRLWVQKKEKAVALWEAKMKLRDAKDERGRPKYGTRDWAAWVLTGDPR